MLMKDMFYIESFETVIRLRRAQCKMVVRRPEGFKAKDMSCSVCAAAVDTIEDEVFEREENAVKNEDESVYIKAEYDGLDDDVISNEAMDGAYGRSREQEQS